MRTAGIFGWEKENREWESGVMQNGEHEKFGKCVVEWKICLYISVVYINIYIFMYIKEEIDFLLIISKIK